MGTIPKHTQLQIWQAGAWHAHSTRRTLHGVRAIDAHAGEFAVTIDGTVYRLKIAPERYARFNDDSKRMGRHIAALHFDSSGTVSCGCTARSSDTCAHMRSAALLQAAWQVLAGCGLTAQQIQVKWTHTSASQSQLSAACADFALLAADALACAGMADRMKTLATQKERNK